MPFCSMCGKPVSDTAAFCGNCGAPQRGRKPAPPKAPSPAPRTPGPTPYAPNPAAYAAPVAKAGGNMLKWLIPLIALGAAAIVVVIVIVSGGDITNIGKSDEQLIRERIAAFEEAYTSGDYDGMLECMDSEMQSITEMSMGLMDGLMGEVAGFDLGVSMTDMFGLVGFMGDFADFVIEDIEINGDTAIVTLTMTMNMYGESSSEVTELPMIKEKGDWYIGGVSDMMGGDILGGLGLY